MGKTMELAGLGLKFLMEWVPVETGLPDDELEALVYRQAVDELRLAYHTDEGWLDSATDAPLDGVSHWTHVEVPR